MTGTTTQYTKSRSCISSFALAIGKKIQPIKCGSNFHMQQVIVLLFLMEEARMTSTMGTPPYKSLIWGILFSVLHDLWVWTMHMLNLRLICLSPKDA